VSYRRLVRQPAQTIFLEFEAHMTPEKTKERFPKNVEGSFFVANGECLSCMAPEQAAPDLMGYDQGSKHGYFKKQPTLSEEVDRAVGAVLAS
jgi:hypothetical protein